MTLQEVPTDLLAVAWPDVEDWIAGACARVPSEHTPDTLRALCERGQACLILIGAPGREPVAAGVTQVRDHQDGSRSCWILALGGTGARTWRDTLKTLEAGARAHGCGTLAFVGRPGWAGLLPGYACHVAYEKRL